MADGLIPRGGRSSDRYQCGDVGLRRALDNVLEPESGDEPDCPRMVDTVGEIQITALRKVRLVAAHQHGLQVDANEILAASLKMQTTSLVLYSGNGAVGNADLEDYLTYGYVAENGPVSPGGSDHPSPPRFNGATLGSAWKEHHTLTVR